MTRNGGGSGDLDRKSAIDSFTGANNLVCRQISCKSKHEIQLLFSGQIVRDQINGNNNGRHFFVSDFIDWIELIL